jgi:peptidoglycan hydrolase FlgJ
MDVASISSQLTPLGLDHAKELQAAKSHDPAVAAKVAKQFEAILLRQILGESMKPMLQSGPSGQVYGYFLTDTLANAVSEGGGLGLAHIIQAQLTQKH